MVLHKFKCGECEVTVEDTDTRKIHMCPMCGQEMSWDIRVAIHGNYKRPIHSDSLAINPCQRAEHEKMFPNIRIDKQNRPVFDNFVDHENYLKKCNLIKHPQRMKAKGKKLRKLPTPDA